MNSPREIIQNWISKLRSGQFKQCFYTNRAGRDTFCAIGLLHLTICEAYKIQWDFNESDIRRWEEKLPINEFHILKAVGDVCNSRLVKSIDCATFLNDESKKSFSEIADYVEETVLPLMS